jgi:protein-S-isoprenylcysteine O-methyltransferase Ste14
MDMSNSPKKSQAVSARPRSAVSGAVGAVGLIGLFSWLLIARAYGMDGPWSGLMNVLWCGAPMVVWSLFIDKVHRNPSTGLDWNRPAQPVAVTRTISLTKLAGLWATWAGIALFYCVCRAYWQGSYVFAMEIFEFIALPLLLLSVPYVTWIDTRLVEPRDGAWHLGRWLLGKTGWDKESIFSHLRSWAVKGFFMAFMLSIVPEGFGNVVRTPIADIIDDPVRLANTLIALMFVIDIAFATVGYLLTMRPLDAHIRSANPFMAGWVAALICYPPFVLMGSGGPLDYHPGTESWTYWLQGHPWALALWGGMLVLLTAFYAWATMAFGLRFSNLTYRGVLTHGPYAFTKHPAYLAKNTFWWLETLPFLVTTNNVNDVIRNTVIMMAVSGVYYWRAKTEEKHLSLEDPAYGDYARWMDEHGLITTRLRRFLGQAPKS